MDWRGYAKPLGWRFFIKKERHGKSQLVDSCSKLHRGNSNSNGNCNGADTLARFCANPGHGPGG